jgi:hypothetical protein
VPRYCTENATGSRTLDGTREQSGVAIGSIEIGRLGHARGPGHHAPSVFCRSLVLYPCQPCATPSLLPFPISLTLWPQSLQLVDCDLGDEVMPLLLGGGLLPALCCLVLDHNPRLTLSLSCSFPAQPAGTGRVAAAAAAAVLAHAEPGSAGDLEADGARHPCQPQLEELSALGTGVNAAALRTLLAGAGSGGGLGQGQGQPHCQAPAPHIAMGSLTTLAIGGPALGDEALRLLAAASNSWGGGTASTTLSGSCGGCGRAARATPLLPKLCTLVLEVRVAEPYDVACSQKLHLLSRPKLYCFSAILVAWTCKRGSCLLQAVTQCAFRLRLLLSCRTATS